MLLIDNASLTPSQKKSPLVTRWNCKVPVTAGMPLKVQKISNVRIWLDAVVRGSMAGCHRFFQVAGSALAVLWLLPLLFYKAVNEFLRDRECRPLFGVQCHDDLAAQLQVVPDLGPRTLRVGYVNL